MTLPRSESETLLIGASELARLVVRRVIFHDVPSHSRSQTVEPVLAEALTNVDAERKAHLKSRLVRVLGSKSAYPVMFNPNSSSPVPPRVRHYTGASRSASQFVSASRDMGQYLFEQQTGTVSSGLLAVIDVAVGGRPGLVLMKLEREAGAQLEMESHGGKRAFAMSVLDNLVLTDSTRLFKSALFVRTGTGDDDFKAVVCDSQLNVTASEDMARFWLRFLGCMVEVEPRVATRRFYDATVTFINGTVTDPVVKNDLYEHLHSALKSNQRMFSPRDFIENNLPVDLRDPYKEYLQSNKIPLAAFQKDTKDLSSALKRKRYETARGATVTVPAEEEEMLTVEPDQLIVRDTVTKVDHK